MEKTKICRICKSKDIAKFLSLGNMPLAGGFIKKDEISNEKKYPLDVYFCKNCSLVQVLDVIPPDDLFKDYRYLSSSTKTLSEHFKKAAEYYKERFFKDKKGFVVEIGSNDGVLLKPLMDLGIDAIGVDPSENVSRIAKSKGLNVIVDYFTKKVAKEIVNK
ncbi:MAG: class I SAM-dependent methyltransferase, partial [Nanoarchaeota archaeon]